MIHFRKIISKVNVKLPTIFAKRSILGAWLGSVCVSADRYNTVPERGNLWTFDTLINFVEILRENGAHESKKYSSRRNCVLWTVLPGNTLFFDETLY